MPDDTTPPAVPAASNAHVQPPATPAAAPAPTAEPIMSSEALTKRLEEERGRERAKLLKELGAENVTAAKSALEAGRKAADEKKTELERLQSQLAEAQKGGERATALETLVARLTEGELSRLPEKVRDVVRTKHPDDPQAQLALVETMREMGLLDGARSPAPSTPSAASPPPAAAPANNGATPPAPTPQAAKTAFAIYTEKQATDPMAAALYLHANKTAIDATRPPPSNQ